MRGKLVVIFNGVHYRGAEDEPDGEEKVVAVTDTAKTDGVLSDLRDWLGANWDPDLTVGDWWERLGLAGWAAPGLPANAYGRAMARADTVLVQREISSFGALGAPAGLGLLLPRPVGMGRLFVFLVVAKLDDVARPGVLDVHGLAHL